MITLPTSAKVLAKQTNAMHAQLQIDHITELAMVAAAIADSQDAALRLRLMIATLYVLLSAIIAIGGTLWLM